MAAISENMAWQHGGNQQAACENVNGGSKRERRGGVSGKRGGENNESWRKLAAAAVAEICG